jgi:hypothetical protein
VGSGQRPAASGQWAVISERKNDFPFPIYQLPFASSIREEGHQWAMRMKNEKWKIMENEK